MRVGRFTVLVAAVNRDGATDIITANTGDLSLLLNTLDPSEAEPPDFNGDARIDSADLGLLLMRWGPCPAPPEPCREDLNGDGLVDGVDLGMLLMGWGPMME